MVQVNIHKIYGSHCILFVAFDLLTNGELISYENKFDLLNRVHIWPINARRSTTAKKQNSHTFVRLLIFGC